MKKLLLQFKAFALGGLLVDLAIGVAIGLAFAAVVDPLVKNIILPLVAAIFGKPSFHSLHASIRGTRIQNGDFLIDFVGFLLLALVILLLVKGINKLTGVEAAGAEGSREDPFRKSFIGVDASVCFYCTRDVEPLVAG